MDKASWVGMGAMLRPSFPDIDYVIEDIREEGAGVKVEGHFVGTLPMTSTYPPRAWMSFPPVGKR
jgi:hypothetical protein